MQMGGFEVVGKRNEQNVANECGCKKQERKKSEGGKKEVKESVDRLGPGSAAEAGIG